MTYFLTLVLFVLCPFRAQFRAILHKLRQRASSVLFQPARLQVRAGRVQARRHPLGQHPVCRQHGLPATLRVEAQWTSLYPGRSVQVCVTVLFGVRVRPPVTASAHLMRINLPTCRDLRLRDLSNLLALFQFPWRHQRDAAAKVQFSQQGKRLLRSAAETRSCFHRSPLRRQGQVPVERIPREESRPHEG